MALSREQILAVDDLVKEEVNVREWDGSVFVRTMTGSERDAFEMQLYNDSASRNMEHFRAKLLSFCVCDEKGARLFTHDDIVALGGKSVKALTKLQLVAQRLNAITESDVAELAKK